METLITRLTKDIIEQLNLEDINEADINPEDPLFGDGLGLDSIDALELIVLLEKNYGVKIESAEEGKEVMASIQSIAHFIEKNAAK